MSKVRVCPVMPMAGHVPYPSVLCWQCRDFPWTYNSGPSLLLQCCKRKTQDSCSSPKICFPIYQSVLLSLSLSTYQHAIGGLSGYKVLALFIREPFVWRTAILPLYDTHSPVRPESWPWQPTPLLIKASSTQESQTRRVQNPGLSSRFPLARAAFDVPQPFSGTADDTALHCSKG